ncbi:MAG: hypothetical protein J7L44_02310 [Candidatus Diapherotrites archaeon]|nr:hypothetical protein [Candidatus Diapherotrites archaeon]
MSKEESKRSFWSAARIAMLFIFLVGIVIGAAIEHYVIEPIISGSFAEELRKCELANTELYESLEQCYAKIESAK